MEAHEASEHIRAVAEDDKAQHERESRFRDRVAILIAVMAALLAVCAILAQKSTEHEINANIDAADVRSTYDNRMTQLQADEETIQADQEQLADPDLPPDVRNLIQQHLQIDEALAGRLQSNPSRGDGIDQLEVQLRTIEREQEAHAARGDSYDLAATLFEIAIVLASVAILVVSFPLVLLSSAVAVAGAFLLLNGLTLLVRI
jgi:cell division protein FtsB